MKLYTVRQLSRLANITPRTLHYYDELGLLKPAQIGDNSYRYYAHDQLTKLVQILFYRELDFSLEEIKKITQNPSFNMTEALLKHKKLLQLQAKRTKRLIKTIDQILTAQKGGEVMNTKKTYQSFDATDINQYKDEVKARWGHTNAYRQSMERTKKWSRAQLEAVKQEGSSITLEIAKISDRPVQEASVQELIKKHHQHISRFYDCSSAMYRTLGEMYFSDPRFAAYYDKYKPGLAEFMCKAIACYCDLEEKSKR